MKTFEEFLSWEQSTRDSLLVRRIYIDMAGDLVAGLMLSQIIYWHLPAHDGDSKLRVKHEGEMWMARARDDWWDDLRITAKQVDRAVGILKKKKLIITDIFQFGGIPKQHIRLNHAAFVKALSKATATDKTVTLPKGKNHKKVKSPKVKEDFTERSKSLDFTERSKSLTENTLTNTTTENTDSASPDGSRDLVFETLAELCEIDIKPDQCTKDQRGKLNQVTKWLKEKFQNKPEDAIVKGLKAFGSWWYAEWWQGQRGTPPDPWDVKRRWASFAKWYKNDRPRGDPKQGPIVRDGSAVKIAEVR